MGQRHRKGHEAKELAAELATSPPCSICGERLGKHRYGDDACPNTDWKPGNGRDQWLETSYCDVPLLRHWH